jgi:hypothetical protein
VALVEDRERERQIDGTHRVHRADRNAASVDAAQALDLGLRRLDLGDDRPGARDEQLTGLGDTRRVVRSTTVRPSSSSKRRICWERAGCAMCSRAAARVKFRSSERATRYRSWRMSIS